MNAAQIIGPLYSMFLGVSGYVLFQYCASLIFEFRFEGKHKFLYILGITILQLTPGFIVKAILPNGSVLRIFLVLIFCTIGFVLPYKGKLFHKILFYFIISIIEYPAELICLNLVLALKITDVWDAKFYFLQTSVYLTIYPIIMLAIWVVFIGKKWNKRISTFIILPIYQMMFVAIVFLLNDVPELVMMIIGSFCTLFDIWLNINVIHIFRDVMKQIETEEKMDMLKRQREYEWEYYRSINQSIEDIRIIRHDFQNQLQTAKILIDSAGESQAGEGKMIKCREDMENLVNKTKEALSEYRNGRFVAHPVADALFNLKKQEAASKQISLEIEGQMGEEWKLTNLEVCSVLGNLLDNAIEACSVNEKSQKWIQVKVEEKEGKYSISCKNPSAAVPKVRNGKWVTAKGGKDHGKGLKAMEWVAQKYGGKLEKSYSDQIATIRFTV